jgi:hypothetical protein
VGVELLAWRKRYGFGRVEAFVLALYAAVLAVTIPFHEPWADEAQAFVLARDSSLWEIFRYRLHYEGTPALWHFLLRVLIVAHVPWVAVGWVCGVIAVAGVAVWLRWSPFPMVVRVLLPFTFFVLYQYGVVARSYVLFPLLLFGLCAVYCARSRQVLWFAVVAGLLANLCLQGAIVSGLFTVLYVWELWHGRVRASGLWRAVAVLVVAWGMCVYAAMPAPDVGFAVQDAVSGGVVHRLLVRYVGETARAVAVRPVDGVVTGMVRPVVDAGWRERMAVRLQPPAKSSALDAAPVAQQGPVVAAGVAVVELLSELLWPIADSSLLGLALLVLMLWWARAHGGLVYFAPALVLWLVGEFLWTTDHHAGMLLLTLLAGVWLTARRAGLAGVESREGMRWRKASWVDGGFVVVLVIVLAGQVVWSASAVWRDHRGVYDPGPELARYLKTLPAGERVAAFHYWSVAAQPYFARNPFFNLPTAYWQWSANVFPDALHKQTLDARPDVVVYTQEEPLADEMRNQILPLNVRRGGEPVDPVLADIEERGYREAQRFCGERFSRLEASFRVCDVVFVAPLRQKP